VFCPPATHPAALAQPDLLALRREFKRSSGWVTDTELRRLLGPSFDALADLVRAELARLLDGGPRTPLP
jgi:hypothetical protein